MIGSLVDLELACHGPAEAPLGEHALDGPLDHALGMAPEHALRAHLAQTADIAGVPPVHLVGELSAREMDLLGVDHHHVIAHVEVRGKSGLVLSAQHVGDSAGQPP
jgi:hypothetical protein